MESIILYAFAYLILKHFVADFLLQGPYQYLNKGTYGHPGGILHTAIITGFSIPLAIYFGSMWPIFLEFMTHYHMDWAKIKLNAYLKLDPKLNKGFWFLLGFDQYFHYTIYVIMIWMWTSL